MVSRVSAHSMCWLIVAWDSVANQLTTWTDSISACHRMVKMANQFRMWLSCVVWSFVWGRSRRKAIRQLFIVIIVWRPPKSSIQTHVRSTYVASAVDSDMSDDIQFHSRVYSYLILILASRVCLSVRPADRPFARFDRNHILFGQCNCDSCVWCEFHVVEFQLKITTSIGLCSDGSSAVHLIWMCNLWMTAACSKWAIYFILRFISPEQIAEERANERGREVEHQRTIRCLQIRFYLFDTVVVNGRFAWLCRRENRKQINTT